MTQESGAGKALYTDGVRHGSGLGELGRCGRMEHVNWVILEF